MRFAISIFSLLSVLSAGATSAQDQDDQDNLYLICIQEVIKGNPNHYNIMQLHGDSIFVFKTSSMGEMPSTICDIKFSYLESYDELIEQAKKVKKDNGYRLFEFEPIKIKQNKLIIEFNHYTVKWKKRKLHFGISDNTKVSFKYDCKVHSFQVISSESKGI